MKKLDIVDVEKCYNCGAKQKKDGYSLHCWDIKYKCGCVITGSISDKDIYLEKECPKNKKIMKNRILLDNNDFEKLTKGEIIKKDDVEIALSDIGYYNMVDIIISHIKN